MAIYHNDPEYAQLLLHNGANPHEKALYPERTNEGPITALDMERTGWLEKMVNELKPQPKKKRNYNY
jgi:hypothetical protein